MRMPLIAGLLFSPLGTPKAQETCAAKKVLAQTARWNGIGDESVRWNSASFISRDFHGSATSSDGLSVAPRTRDLSPLRS
jgi:hypothetical protein